MSDEYYYQQDRASAGRTDEYRALYHEAQAELTVLRAELARAQAELSTLRAVNAELQRDLAAARGRAIGEA